MLNRYKIDMLSLLETKVLGHHVDEICWKIGFKNWVQVESVGFSRGIWIFWNDNLIVDVIQTNPLFLILKIKQGNSTYLFCSKVYASPFPTWRKFLWQEQCQQKL